MFNFLKRKRFKIGWVCTSKNKKGDSKIIWKCCTDDELEMLFIVNSMEYTPAVYDRYRDVLIKDGTNIAEYSKLFLRRRDFAPTRLEVVDETGRAYVKHNVKIRESLQDDGKTLKIFVSNE